MANTISDAISSIFSLIFFIGFLYLLTRLGKRKSRTRRAYGYHKKSKYDDISRGPTYFSKSRLPNFRDQIAENKTILEKGEMFEDYIQSLFSNYYTFLPRTESYPDFKVRFNPTREIFVIECKWRKQLYENSYNINEREFNNYKEYHYKNKIPFFVVLGLGGTPAKPYRMFIIPLEQLKYSDIKNHYLNQFERLPHKTFWYDPVKKQLS